MFNKLVNTLGIMSERKHSVCKLLGFIIFIILQNSDQGPMIMKNKNKNKNEN